MRLTYLIVCFLIFSSVTFSNDTSLVIDIKEKIETEMGAEYMSYFTLTLKGGNNYECIPKLFPRSGEKIHGTISFAELKPPNDKQLKFFVIYPVSMTIKWNCARINR